MLAKHSLERGRVAGTFAGDSRMIRVIGWERRRRTRPSPVRGRATISFVFSASSSVVLPDPRKPETTRTGMRLSMGVRFMPEIITWPMSVALAAHV